MYIPPHTISQMLSYAALVKLGVAKDFGLNVFQFLSLVLVGTIKPVSIKDLRKHLSIPGSTLTSTIDSLERKKLIKRQRNKEDRRQWFLLPTAKGERIYQQIIKAEDEAISPALQGLSESEKTVFIKVVREISNTALRIKSS